MRLAYRGPRCGREAAQPWFCTFQYGCVACTCCASLAHHQRMPYQCFRFAGEIVDIVYCPTHFLSPVHSLRFCERSSIFSWLPVWFRLEEMLSREILASHGDDGVHVDGMFCLPATFPKSLPNGRQPIAIRTLTHAGNRRQHSSSRSPPLVHSCPYSANSTSTKPSPLFPRLRLSVNPRTPAIMLHQMKTIEKHRTSQLSTPIASQDVQPTQVLLHATVSVST